MHSIDSIKPKGRHFFTLKLGDGRTHVIHEDTVFKHGLLRLRELSSSTLEAALTDDAYHTLMHRALNKLAMRDYARKGLAQVLKDYATNGQVIAQVLDTLEHQGYIDDEKVINRLVKEASEFGDKGPKRLRDDFLKDGFDAHAIEDALVVFTEEKQRAIVARLIDKHMPTLFKDPQAKKRQKLMQLLYRKGFEPTQFEPLINEALRSDSTDETALLQRRLEKLKRSHDTGDYESKRKLIQKLMREGFAYGEIIRALEGETL